MSRSRRACRALLILVLVLCLIAVYAGGMFFRDDAGAISDPRLRAVFGVLFLGVLGGLGYALLNDSLGWKPLLQFGGIALVTLALFEGSLSVLMNHPGLAKGLSGTVLQKYNFNAETNMIQFLPACAQYDPDLFYTLRPGTCRFENHEFSVEFRVNSLGVRDDESSLDQPEVVVLGDSYAMGWGVEQDQTLSRRIEDRTGLNVLNAAVSSYGTARQFRLLDRISTAKLRYLIVQYCENDFLENAEYAATGTLSIKDRGAYEEAVRQHARTTRYYVGKHAFNVLGLLQTEMALALRPSFQKVLPRPRPPGTAAAGQSGESNQARGTEDIDAFLRVIETAPVDLSQVKIIVFDVPNPRVGKSRFIRDLREKVALAPPGRLRNIQAIDLSENLAADDFFVLDLHFNAQGHRKIAERLLAVMNVSGAAPPAFPPPPAPRTTAP